MTAKKQKRRAKPYGYLKRHKLALQSSTGIIWAVLANERHEPSEAMDK